MQILYKLDQVLIASCYDEQVRQVPASLINALVAQWQPQAIYAKYRPRAAAKVDEAAMTELAPTRPVWGKPVEQVVVQEAGLSYELRPNDGLSIGLYADMRETRQRVRNLLAKRQLRVLNTFAYTCGFSVTAIEGGAAHVVNLDMAKAALSRGRENHRLNQHDLSRVSFLGHELFKSWGKVKKCGPYDLVIIDPPSFQKGSFALTQDYQKILRRLPELLTEQGTVLACVNDPDIGPEFLLAGMAEHAPSLSFVERLANQPEFADINPDSGLKALVFKRSSAATD